MSLPGYPGHPVILAIAMAGLVAVAAGVRLRPGGTQADAPGTRLARFTLGALHCVALLTLVWILCDPSREAVSQVSTRTSVLALFDSSRSMSVADNGYHSRLDQAIRAFEARCHPAADQGPAYSLLGFDSEAYRCDGPAGLRRWGEETHGEALVRFLSRNLADPRGSGPCLTQAVAGVIVFSDGQVDSRSLDALAACRDDVPVWVVGVGSKDPPSDVAVVSLDAPGRVGRGRSYLIEAAVACVHPVRSPVLVDLLRDGQVVETRPVSLGSAAFGQETKRVSFEVRAAQVGTESWVTRVQVPGGDGNPANDERAVVVDVVEPTRTRVLLYAERLDLNVGKVRQALALDAGLDLDVSLDALQVRRLARKAAGASGYVPFPYERREFYVYDVIVLGPCDPDRWDADQRDGLYSFVADRGGGVILLSCHPGDGPWLWQEPRMSALVPVLRGLDQTGPDRPSGVLTPAADADSIAGLRAGELGGDVLMRPCDAGLEPKPAATTLAVIEGVPAVAVHRVGRGRAGLLNIAALHRAYRADQEGGSLARVLGQLVYHVAQGAGPDSHIQVCAEGMPGSRGRVRIRALVSDDAFCPVPDAHVLVEAAGGITRMVPQGDGMYAALVDRPPGQSLLVTVEAQRHGRFLGERTSAVDLGPVQDEMSDVRLDETYLRSLARAIKGRYVHIDDLPLDLSKGFRSEQVTEIRVQTTSLWPAWSVWAVLCTCLAVGWFLRRSLGWV